MNALAALKDKLRTDLAEFRRDVGWRLPAALESVSATDIRQHLGPFLDQAFRDWAERENAEVQAALTELSPVSGSEPPRTPDARLLRPVVEVSTFAVDASVVAALALGVGTLFANAALGGLFLVAAPTLATIGKHHHEQALRQRAAESAMKAIDTAVAELGLELEQVIDEFGRRLMQPASL
jgi:hypothetical protein